MRSGRLRSLGEEEESRLLFYHSALAATIQKIRSANALRPPNNHNSLQECWPRPSGVDLGRGESRGRALVGTRTAPILLPSRSQQYEFFVTISLYFATKALSPGAFLHLKSRSKIMSQGLMALTLVGSLCPWTLEDQGKAPA
jgi:hypothetical protein